MSSPRYYLHDGTFVNDLEKLARVHLLLDKILSLHCSRVLGPARYDELIDGCINCLVSIELIFSHIRSLISL